MACRRRSRISAGGVMAAKSRIGSPSARVGRGGARGEEEVAADRIEGGVGGEGADAVAIAGELVAAFTGAVRIGDADVDEADWFFWRAAAGAGDASNADADGGAGAAANSVSEGE